MCICFHLWAYASQIPLTKSSSAVCLRVINVGGWLSYIVSVKVNHFFVSMRLGHATYITGLDCSRCNIKLLCIGGCIGGGCKNKKISQLIHLPARKSHYTADEFKDCLRWKGAVFMALQSCVPSLPVSCGWKNKRHADGPAKWILSTSNTSGLFTHLNTCFRWRVMSYEVFIRRWLNEDRYDGWENWSDLSCPVRDMNLSRVFFISGIERPRKSSFRQLHVGHWAAIRGSRASFTQPKCRVS